MATRDLMNDVHPVLAFAPVVIADNTAATSGAIDTAGYESATFVIATGTLADVDATFTVEVLEGDTATQGEHTAVADADLIGTEALASFTFAGDDSCFKIGYKGTKRYVSISVTPAANTGNAPLAAICVLGHPEDRPTSNPPA